jgi:hypothetical protein
MATNLLQDLMHLVQAATSAHQASNAAPVPKQPAPATQANPPVQLPYQQIPQLPQQAPQGPQPQGGPSMLMQMLGRLGQQPQGSPQGSQGAQQIQQPVQPMGGLQGSAPQLQGPTQLPPVQR